MNTTIEEEKLTWDWPLIPKPATQLVASKSLDPCIWHYRGLQEDVVTRPPEVRWVFGTRTRNRMRRLEIMSFHVAHMFSHSGIAYPEVKPLSHVLTRRAEFVDLVLKEESFLW